MSSTDRSRWRHGASRRRLAASVLVVTGLLAAPARAADGEKVAEVTQLRGTGIVMRGSDSATLAVGVELLSTDRVLTDKDSRAKIRFIDGTVVTVGAGSELYIAEYAATAGARESSLLSLLRGILRAAVAPHPGNPRFEVETRVAVASVRSTDFVVEAKPNATAVFVVEGEVAVSTESPPASVQLGPGFGTDVTAGAPPQPAKQWGARRVQDVLARTSLP